jgi:hypothetical protein
MLGGDYFIDMLRYSYTVLVNMDMYNEIFAGEGGSESLFELVKAGEWTYDEMMRCADMAYVDAGSIGQGDDEDTFGIVYDISWAFRSLLATSGVDIFEKNADGQIQYVEDITEMHNFVDKLVNMGKHDSWRKDGTTGTNSYDVFISGKSLFTLDAPVLMMEGTYLQSMDDSVALIPYPKYNKEVKYGALISDNANVGGIAYSSDKFTACSAFLQMATEESNTGKGSLIHEYYDVSLKYKLSSTPEQVAMLELVRTGLCSPKSFLYDNYFAKSVGMQTCGNLMRSSFNAATNTFASDWEAQYSAVQSALESTLTTYGGN